MIFLYTFALLSFITSALVVTACMLSSRISQREETLLETETYQQEVTVPLVVSTPL